MTPIRVLSLVSLTLLLGTLFACNEASAGGVSDELAEILRDLPPGMITTGILYDRVIPLSRIENHDGSPESLPATAAAWRQMYSEIYRASLTEPAWPTLQTLRRESEPVIRGGVIPIGVMNFRYNRIRADALQTGALVTQDGRLAVGEGDPFREGRLFAAAPLEETTYSGERVVFRLDRGWYFTNVAEAPAGMQIDFDDGRGLVPVSFGREYPVRYVESGPKTLRIQFTFADGTILHARSLFGVKALQIPVPDDTLQITASIPYLGEHGTGEAYVYLADSHESLTNPVMGIEGFDIDNSMNWEELYLLFNQEELLETVRAMGFDAVVLNFTDGTDYIQRNAFVLVELIGQVNSLIDQDSDIALVGASMGGLVSRFALAYMETNGLEHNVRNFISFDSPQTGANIPLGVQYWVAFFASESDEAAGFLEGLDSPAARQMLAYHHTDPPGATGESDPLRAELQEDLAAVGDYPGGLRKVAMANGSAAQVHQGFLPGDQIILWEFSNILVDIKGNVWAVPDGTSHIIFEGLIDPIFLPPDELNVVVSGTDPFDNAPGGWRSSMAQMDAVEAPYGDIIALHDNHCFIPTISALALETDDLFYDIVNDEDILAMTPFDAVYFPLENQEHAGITPENKEWLIAEILTGVTAVEPTSTRSTTHPVISSVSPNPFSSASRILLTLPKALDIRLAVYDAAGRRVTVIADGFLSEGRHQIVWNGVNGGGLRVGSGIYFLRLSAERFVSSRKVLVK